MPLGLKLLVDQPVCVGSFAGPRPQRRCRRGAQRFAFQSRAGTGADFTTGTRARPPLPPSLRAGDAAAASEGSAPCSERIPGRGNRGLSWELSAQTPGLAVERRRWEREGLVREGKVLVDLGGCREVGGDAPRPGVGGKWWRWGQHIPPAFPPRVSLAVPAVPPPQARLWPRRCCPALPRPVCSPCGHCKPFPETSGVWVWVQAPFSLLSPLQCPCQSPGSPPWAVPSSRPGKTPGDGNGQSRAGCESRGSGDRRELLLPRLLLLLWPEGLGGCCCCSIPWSCEEGPRSLC